MKSAVIVDNVSKDFRLYEKNSHIIKELFSKKQYHKTKKALKNISFEVAEGESFGILGSNGSGKSTILQIINGTTFPTTGSVTINGTSSLLNVGAGMLKDYTGMENIYYKCGLLGLTKKQINERLESIIEFSEVREFLDQPLKKYSSGMKAKLGFSIAIHVEPEVLIIDEALAVGDQMFRDKCFKKIDELKKKNVTILFVSHSDSQVNRVCDRACWIQAGEMIIIDEAKTVTKYYNQFTSRKKSLKEIKAEIKESNELS